MEGVYGNFTTCQYMENDTQCQLFYTKIIPFESYDKILNNKEKYCCIQFDRQQSFTLKLFIDAIKNKYLRVYEGQIIQIAKLVLLHFQKLQNKNICHGNLSQENIIISLEQSSPRLETYAKPVKISKINFINYELNPQKQYNKLQNDESRLQKDIFTLLKLISFQKLQDQITKFENDNTTSLLRQLQTKFEVSEQLKIEQYDVEEYITSSRYLKSNYLRDQLKSIYSTLNSFKDQILQQLKKEAQEVERNFVVINEQIKDNKQTDQNNMDDTEIIGGQTSQISEQHKQFSNFSVEYFIQNLHDHALYHTMKDIGQYLEGSSFSFGVSLKTSQEAIQLNFKIQKEQFVNLLQQCSNMRKDFMKIFMDINSKKQEHFKINIQLSFEQSFFVLIEELYYFIISQQKLKSENILQSTRSNEFKEQWEPKMRAVIQEIYDSQFQLEVLKLIESLI